MSLSVKQSQTYAGNGRWRWSVWLNGDADELDSVDYVMYVLHPTFTKPVRQINDRVTNFRLDTSGWGTFTVHVRIVYRDGREALVDHDLQLQYPDGMPTLA